MTLRPLATPAVIALALALVASPPRVAAQTDARPAPSPLSTQTPEAVGFPESEGGIVRCRVRNCRETNAIVMDLDFVQYAAERGADAVALTGDLEGLLDQVASRDALRASNGMIRKIVWEQVDGTTHECVHPDDAGILEIRDASLTQENHQYVFFGHQTERAKLAFRILGCAGDERLRYPAGRQTGTASFSPYYLSIYGTAGLISLADVGRSGGETAAIVGALSGNSSLALNVGAHDPQNRRALVRYRLMVGDRRGARGKGAAPPTPDPGSLPATLARCRFAGRPITIVCR